MMTILIVDDERNILTIIKRMLIKIGDFKILEASDGEAALAILQAIHHEETIDLIISDWGMPGLTGLDLLRKVRSDATSSQIKFLMLTGRATKEDVLEAIEEKVSHYIVKPFNFGDFEKIIRTILHL